MNRQDILDELKRLLDYYTDSIPRKQIFNIIEQADTARGAFDRAIDAGRLSADPDAENYAGHYMYMGHCEGGDAFKHIITREYLPINK